MAISDSVVVSVFVGGPTNGSIPVDLVRDSLYSSKTLAWMTMIAFWATEFTYPQDSSHYKCATYSVCTAILRIVTHQISGYNIGE